MGAQGSYPMLRTSRRGAIVDEMDRVLTTGGSVAGVARELFVLPAATPSLSFHLTHPLPPQPPPLLRLRPQTKLARFAQWLFVTLHLKNGSNRRVSRSADLRSTIPLGYWQVV
jgi:hypothetical protein